MRPDQYWPIDSECADVRARASSLSDPAGVLANGRGVRLLGIMNAIQLAIDRRKRATLAVLVVALSLCAWSQRWLQDDAYITFRYARHLATGYGPVWNQGLAVEGYSNFLWMLVLAGLHRAGLGPEVASQLLGVACFAGSLLLVFRLGQKLLPGRWWALAACWLTGTNYTFFMYATGGLETQLMAMLVLAALTVVVSASQRRHLRLVSAVALSAYAGLALLTRPDSPLLVFVCFAFAIGAAKLWKGELRLWLGLMGPLVVLVVPWLYWKYQLYGDLLPNTFAAKASIHSSLTLARGATYVGWLFLSYWWLPAALAIGWKARRHFRLPPLSLLPLLAYVALWLAYVVWAGGDIMELRMVVSIIPLFILLLLAALATMTGGRFFQLSIVALLCGGSLVHCLYFGRYVRPAGIGTIPQLRQSVQRDDPASWASMGEKLRQYLGGNGGATLAVSPAGAIPYLSEQRTIDCLGLSDKWVARQGFLRRKCTVCQGHARLATIAYLQQQNVHLLIGQPQVMPSGDPLADPSEVVRAMFFGEDLDYYRIPDDAWLVRIPLEGGLDLAALYLARTPRVDALLSAGTWQGQPLAFRSPSRVLRP